MVSARFVGFGETAYLQLLLTVEDLARRNRVLRVKHIPVIYGLGADEGKCGLADPSPELNVLLMAVGLQALFGLEVEELQRPTLRLERDNRLGQVHDSTVRADRSPYHIVRIL